MVFGCRATIYIYMLLLFFSIGRSMVRTQIDISVVVFLLFLSIFHSFFWGGGGGGVSFFLGGLCFLS